MSPKTVWKLLNWKSTVAKAWTEIQAQNLSPLLPVPYKTGRAPSNSSPDFHPCKWQDWGDECSCLLIQSSAPDLSRVIPDVHQRSDSGLWNWKSDPFPSPLAPFPSSILEKNDFFSSCTVGKPLTEIRGLVCVGNSKFSYRVQKIPNVLWYIPTFFIWGGDGGSFPHIYSVGGHREWISLKVLENLCVRLIWFIVDIYKVKVGNWAPGKTGELFK